MLTFMSI